MMNNFATTKVEVNIDDIRPNPWNPNQMDSKTFEKEKKSITELGFLGSIIVREHNIPGYYEILDGEHRWKAAKELGYTKMAVESVGKISDQQVKLLTILLNNLKGKDDVFKRAKLLEALDEGQLQLLPMTADEIENEKRLISFDWDKWDVEDEEREKQFGKVVVLQFTKEEGQVWEKAKEELMKRGMLKSKNKKRQDVEMAMRMMKGFLGLAIGIGEDGTITFEEIIT